MPAKPQLKLIERLTETARLHTFIFAAGPLSATAYQLPDEWTLATSRVSEGSSAPLFHPFENRFVIGIAGR